MSFIGVSHSCVSSLTFCCQDTFSTVVKKREQQDKNNLKSSFPPLPMCAKRLTEPCITKCSHNVYMAGKVTIS